MQSRPTRDDATTRPSAIARSTVLDRDHTTMPSGTSPRTSPATDVDEYAHGVLFVTRNPERSHCPPNDRARSGAGGRGWHREVHAPSAIGVGDNGFATLCSVRPRRRMRCAPRSRRSRSQATGLDRIARGEQRAQKMRQAASSVRASRGDVPRGARHLGVRPALTRLVEDAPLGSGVRTSGWRGRPRRLRSIRAIVGREAPDYPYPTTLGGPDVHAWEATTRGGAAAAPRSSSPRCGRGLAARQPQPARRDDVALDLRGSARDRPDHAADVGARVLRAQR